MNVTERLFVETDNDSEESKSVGLAKRFLSWVVVVGVLVLLGDIPISPVPILAKRWFGTGVAVVAGFSVSFLTQWFVIWQSLKPKDEQFRFFSKLLDLLGLTPNDSGDSWMDQRKNQLQAQVTGAGSAVAMTFLLGGAVPIVLLRRIGFPVRKLRFLGVVTASIWASCFVAIWVFGVGYFI